MTDQLTTKQSPITDEQLDEFISDAKAFADKWKAVMGNIYGKDVTPAQRLRLEECEKYFC